MDNDTVEARCKALVESLGLGRGDAVSEVTPLTGGVASDIARFQLGTDTYCAKFALPKLKVAEDWHAPVHRNAAEYAWLEFANRTCPKKAVQLYGRSATQNGFVMEFINGADVYLWKTALLEEAPDRGEGPRVAALLGTLQAASTRPGFDASPFQNWDDFRALRIEPYLTFTANRHPDLKAPLTGLADMLYAANTVLVHGDISPKNILFRGAGPMFLDAECATMGDASFDPAFCLNHLMLKALHLPLARHRLLDAIDLFWTGYASHITFEAPAAVEQRITRLLPALMLARVDGKSPVEYLSDETRTQVRQIARALILTPETTLSALVARIRDNLP